MIDFKQIYESLIQEALTIPPNENDKTEIELRQKLPSYFEHGDRVIRWYRLEKKIAAKKNADIERTGQMFVRNLGNLLDSLRLYDSLMKKAKSRGRLNTEFEAVDMTGKHVKLNPKTFLDSKYLTAKQAEEYIGQLDKVLNSETDIDNGSTSGAEKYAIKDSDRKNIRLIGFDDKVCVWATRTFESTNKLVFQLWQNADTMDSAGAYGDPMVQSPYCTHAKSHWDNLSNNDPNYQQFWYLKRVPGLDYAVGDLTNPATVKTFNGMLGTGPDTICALNDSMTCWNDRMDSSDRFGGDKLIDDMVLDSEYDFNGLGLNVQRLYHEYFHVLKPDVPENEIRYIFALDKHDDIVLTRNDSDLYGQTDLKSANSKSLKPIRPINAEIDVRFSDYAGDSYGDTRSEFKNGFAYPMSEEIVCNIFNIDVELPSLKNFPKRIHRKDPYFNSRVFIDGPVQSLEGCPEIIVGKLVVTDGNSIKSFDGISKKVRQLKIICPDSIRTLKGLENTEISESFEIEEYQGTSLEHMPKSDDNNPYECTIAGVGQEISLVGLPTVLASLSLRNIMFKSFTGMPLEIRSRVDYDEEQLEMFSGLLYDIFSCMNLYGKNITFNLKMSGVDSSKWISDKTERERFEKTISDKHAADILKKLTDWYLACSENKKYYVQHDDMFPDMDENTLGMLLDLFDTPQWNGDDSIIRDRQAFIEEFFKLKNEK